MGCARQSTAHARVHAYNTLPTPSNDICLCHQPVQCVYAGWLVVQCAVQCRFVHCPALSCAVHLTEPISTFVVFSPVSCVFVHLFSPSRHTVLTAGCMTTIPSPCISWCRHCWTTPCRSCPSMYTSCQVGARVRGVRAALEVVEQEMLLLLVCNCLLGQQGAVLHAHSKPCAWLLVPVAAPTQLADCKRADKDLEQLLQTLLSV